MPSASWTASIPAPPRRACATSRRAGRSRRRGSARSTRRARSRSPASAARRRSPRPARPAARCCATSSAAAWPRGCCTPGRGRRARRSSALTPPSNTRHPMQTPAPFDYERATSVEGAIAALARLGSDARIIAGGHSLLPMMKLRLASPSHLIDINDLEELAYIRRGGHERASGALPRHVDLLESDLLAAAFPAFRDAEQVIADPVVRNRGTIGGSLCQADAAEDLSAVCAAAKARVVIRGTDGERTVAMSDFH